MKNLKMAQVDPLNFIQHISIWMDTNKAPTNLVEVSDFAQIGMTLQELEQLDVAEAVQQERLRLALLQIELENLESQQDTNSVT